MEETNSDLDIKHNPDPDGDPIANEAILDLDMAEENFEEEYATLNTTLDQIDTALDRIESRNDDLYSKLQDLLESNKQCRRELEQERLDIKPESSKAESEDADSGESGTNMDTH